MQKYEMTFEDYALQIKSGYEGLLPLLQANGTQKALLDSEIDERKRQIEQLRLDIDALKEQKRQAEVELEVEKGKTANEVARIYQEVNKRNAESLALLDRVKEFVNEVEKRKYVELRKQQKELVSA